MYKKTVKINQLQDILSRSYSTILVDRVDQFEPTKSIIATKNVTLNEPYFLESALAEPVMPENLQLEALAQAASIIILQMDDYEGMITRLAGMKEMRFIRPIVPGDTLRLEVRLENIKDNEAQCRGRIYVGNELAVEGSLSLAIAAQGMGQVKIDRMAHVHSTAKLAPGVRVGPYAIIDENAQIGENTIIDAHAVIGAGSILGCDCHIHYGAVIGDLPQDVKYAGEKTNVVMGDRNRIREYVTINRATGLGNKTVLGNDNILMSHVHIGHNCKLGNNIVIVSLSQLAGHVTIEDRVTIGGMVGIPQFLRVGTLAMIGGYARLFQDIPPYMLAEGNPAEVQAINAVGLKRNSVNREVAGLIKDAYRLIYRSELNTSQALERIKAECSLNGRMPAEIEHLIDFIKNSHKGINRKQTSTELLSSEGSGFYETEGFFVKMKNILIK